MRAELGLLLSFAAAPAWAGRLVSCRFASEREAALAMAEHLEAKLRKGAG